MSDLIDRQTAYEVLSEYYHHRTETQHKVLRVALDMVPLATHSNTSNVLNALDCVSRQAVIEALAKWFCDVFGIKESDRTTTIFKRLREILSTQPRWIPVTERLPDFGIPVLLNERFAYAVGYLLKTTEGKYEWGVNGWYNNLEDWSAWMPLPEPWKGETDAEID